MAELTYIEHLKIPVKYRGNILHAYEYNATVGKINEIVDNLHSTYEFNKNFPRFDKIDDIFASTGTGTPVMINNEHGKLYPITSSAYVLIDNDKNLDTELNILNSQITSGLTDVLNKIAQTNELINTNLAYSYSYAYTYSYINAKSLVDELREDVNSQINDVRTNVSNIHTELTNSINDTKDLSYAYTDKRVNELSTDTTSKLGYLQKYVNDLNTYFTDIVKELGDQHTLDVSNILSYIPSYVAGFGININDENEVSVNTSSIVDNKSIYVNSYGQLVVNNEVVLANAESKFKFIDENGKWVGDMANVKNYIDDSVNNVREDLTTYINNNTSDINELRSYVNTEVNNLYERTNKFPEYDIYGKNYQLSKEFMQSQE